MDGSVDFEVFCLRHNTSLIRLLTLYCGDHETARDLTQETLARVWSHWGRVRRMDRPDLWAKRVALNLANSQFRRGRMERARRHLLVADPTQVGPEDGERFFVQDSLRRLTPRQRTAVLLRFLEDLSVEQTSELMGCSQGTVKKLTARALVELRATVGPELEVDSDV